MPFVLNTPEQETGFRSDNLMVQADSNIISRDIKRYSKNVVAKEWLIFKEWAVLQEHRSEQKALQLDFVEKRLTGNPIRPFYISRMYLLVMKGVKVSDISFRKIPFLFELVLCVQYYDNQILDKKYNIDNALSIEQNRQHASYLKELIFKYIEDDKNGLTVHLKKNKDIERQKIISQVKDIVTKAFLYCDIGQLIEKRYCTYQEYSNPKDRKISKLIDDLISEVHADKPISNNDTVSNLLRSNIMNGLSNRGEVHLSIGKEIEDFIDLNPVKPLLYFMEEHHLGNASYNKIYFSRIYLTCAALYVLSTKLILDIAGVNKETKKNILSFVSIFGIMRQWVNDNTDFLPSSYNLSTSAKVPKDGFSDLRNGNITMPIILHLSLSPSGAIAEALKTANNDFLNSNFDEKRCYSEALEYQSIFLSISLSKEVSREAIRLLSKVSKRKIEPFKYMAYIAEYNKFYRNFYKTKSFNNLTYYVLYQRSPKMRALAKEIKEIYVMTLKESNPFFYKSIELIANAIHYTNEAVNSFKELFSPHLRKKTLQID